MGPFSKPMVGPIPVPVDNLGFSELTIAALLGHAARGVTQRYIHIDEALRLAADKVSAEITVLLGGGKDRPEKRLFAAEETVVEQ